MQPGSTCVRRALAGALLAALVLCAHGVRAANDAAAGYESIRPSLVKVWTFDRAGRPTQSGTGIVVASSDRRSVVLTASHVLTGAASIRIDVSRDLHDLPATVERTGPRDLTLLTVERGGLRVARFAPRTRTVVEGNLVAVAGYVKNDELIGVVGQEPRVLFPGTVASRPENGLYLELENVHVEEGLSGGPVFDPGTGEVLGVVTSRTSDSRGGFADSGALVVVPFLTASDVAAGVRSSPPPPRPAEPARAVAVALTAPPLRAEPLATLHAVLALPLPPPPEPAASAPSPLDADAVAWQAGAAQPVRFVFVRGGCRIAVTIDVSSLQFVVAHQALVPPRRRGALLGITLAQQASATDACANVPDEPPTGGAYDPTAMSFDGRHVTMRFVYAGAPENRERFPSDASVDADLGASTATATVQFFDSNWTGSIALPLARTALASVSSTW